jgi:translation initiation factor 2B subunit (eIF-2B alpha/beta/delta family)
VGRRLEAAVVRFAQDRSSGSSELARAAARLLAAARRAGLGSRDLERLGARLVQAHPTMAAVWNVVHAADAERLIRQIRRHTRLAARHARRLLPPGGLIVTISYSATVIEALRGSSARVIVARSLPGGEGERTAERLKANGLWAAVMPDAAMGQWAAAADAVLLGADAVTPRGIVNKVGSRLLALAARAERVPCYVVADGSKLAPAASGFPLPLLGPGALFEYVEWGLISRLITERGELSGRLAERWLEGRRARLSSGVPRARRRTLQARGSAR